MSRDFDPPMLYAISKRRLRPDGSKGHSHAGGRRGARPNSRRKRFARLTAERVAREQEFVNATVEALKRGERPAHAKVFEP